MDFAHLWTVWLQIYYLLFSCYSLFYGVGCQPQHPPLQPTYGFKLHLDNTWCWNRILQPDTKKKRKVKVCFSCFPPWAVSVCNNGHRSSVVPDSIMYLPLLFFFFTFSFMFYSWFHHKFMFDLTFYHFN